MDAVLPFAEILNLDTGNMPSKAEREAAKGLTGSFGDILGGKVVVVGEFDESDWKVAGQVSPDYVNGDLDGRVRVVGKIASRWSQGQWKPVMALPGTSLLPREQRRRMERMRPDPGQESSFLEGPAIMLDLLAIYR
jgi:hypothetical protein